MSTQSQNAGNDSALGASESRLTEEYGGENLPVLIQLPDVSAPIDVSEPVVVDHPDREVKSSPANPPPDGDLVDDQPATIPMTGVESECEHTHATTALERPTETGQLRQQRQRRRQRATRGEQESATPWLGGIRQLGLAAVLAAVLLAVIVAFKNRNAVDPQPSTRSDPAPFVEAPSLDFGDPVSGSDIRESRGPDLGSPTFTGHESPLDPAFPARPAHTPGRAGPSLYGEQSRAAGSSSAVSGATHRTIDASAYPSTGVDRPVATAPGAPVNQDARGWRETLPVGTRHAERPAAPPYDQQLR